MKGVTKRQNLRKALIIISFLLFPVTIYYLSPVLIVMGAYEGIVAGSFVLFTALFISSLFLGRAFCGWMCPAGGLQEICTLTADKRAKGGRRDWIKYFIWVPWMLSIIILFTKSQVPVKVDVFYQTYRGISVAEPGAYIVYYGVVGLIVIMSLTGGRRSFCHYVCWMAPFMVIGTKVRRALRLPSLRIISDKNKCISCRICDKKCPMSLGVKDMVHRDSMENSECILCGECVDSCPKGSIRYGFLSGIKGKDIYSEHDIDS